MAQPQGTIVQCVGAVTDIEFPRESMPGIYDALVLEDTGEGGLAEKGLTFEVEQQLGDGVVRCIALGSSDGLRRGMKVTSTGAPISVPMHARPHRGRARPSDRRRRPDQVRQEALDPPDRAQVR
jgi:F0F1-type ATP synthase beta subunit